MEGKINMTVDEDRVWERVRLVIPRIKKIRRLKIFSWIICVPCMLVLCFNIWGMFYIRGKVNLVAFALLAAYMFIFWYGVWGIVLRCRRAVKKEIKNREFPIEQEITFNETELKAESPNAMVRLEWEYINVAHEDENYLMFGDEFIIIDKKMITKEEYDFLLQKKDEIKGRKKRRS